jgi:hypothetical protein
MKLKVDVKKATPPKDQNQQNAILQPQWNQFQNWNAMGGNYFPTDSSVPGNNILKIKIKFYRS